MILLRWWCTNMPEGWGPFSMWAKELLCPALDRKSLSIYKRISFMAPPLLQFWSFPNVDRKSCTWILKWPTEDSLVKVWCQALETRPREVEKGWSQQSASRLLNRARCTATSGWFTQNYEPDYQWPLGALTFQKLNKQLQTMYNTHDIMIFHQTGRTLVLRRAGGTTYSWVPMAPAMK